MKKRVNYGVKPLATKGINHWMMKITMIALEGKDEN
jgi:hypothetical protein